MKLLLIPDNTEQILENYQEITGIIVGIEDLSVNVAFLLSEKEINGFLEKFSDRKIFFCLNKNYQNNDLDYLTRVLKKIKNHDILFYDLSLLSINEEHNLKLNLIWHNEHFATNYESFQVLKKHQVTGMVISPDLNLNEIKAVVKKKQALLLMPIFGHQPIFNSYRSLIKNFFAYQNIKKDTKNLKLVINEKEYLIEDNNGTTVYSPIINGFGIIDKLAIDYFIVNGFKIDNHDLNLVIKGQKQIGEQIIFFQKQHYRLGDKK